MGYLGITIFIFNLLKITATINIFVGIDTNISSNKRGFDESRQQIQIYNEANGNKLRALSPHHEHVGR